MTAQGVYRQGSVVPPGELGGNGDRPSTPDLVVVGAASRDLVADDPRGWRLGGAVTYGSLTAARLGVRVGCLVGVDDLAARALELDLLRSVGVDVVPVRLSSGPVFRNLEQGERRTQQWLSAADPIESVNLPAGWAAARAWMFGPIGGELPAEWAEVPPAEALVSLGWQGLLREFAPGGAVHRVPPRPEPLLSRASLVCASVDDFAPDADLASLRGVIARNAVLVATAGSRGGVVFRAAETATYPAVPARVVDPTGAGDVFLAALMAGWLAGDAPAGARSLRLAAAAASCAVEGPGVLGVPTRAAVEARLRAGR